MPEATFNPYEILGCDPSATDAEIKAAYREAAQKAHPDRKGGSAEQMSLVNQAYQLLCDPQKRAAFDAGHSTELPFSLGRRAKDFVLEPVRGGHPLSAGVGEHGAPADQRHHEPAKIPEGVPA